MKLLIYTNIIPYPLNEGGKVAQFYVIKELCKHIDIVLVSSGDDSKQKLLNEFAKEIPTVKVVYINENKNKSSKSIFKKIWDTLQWKIEKYYIKNQTPQQKVLSNSYFTNPIHIKTNTFISQWNDLIQTEKPDCIQIDFIDNADMAFLVPKQIPSIIIVHDIRFASFEQLLNIHHVEETQKKYLLQLLSTQEFSYINLFDKVIVFSKDDTHKLQTVIPINKIAVSPFAINNSLFNEAAVIRQYKKLVFIGPSHHIANLDALYWFQEHLYNKIIQKFDITIEVIGNWPTDIIQKFKQSEQIKFVGFVDDLKTYLNDCILLVPLRIGSGIRAKIIDAFAMQVPVIASNIALEGLDVKHKKEVLIANSVDENLEALNLLLKTSIAESIVNAAFQYANLHFHPQSVAQKRLDIINTLVKEKN